MRSQVVAYLRVSTEAQEREGASLAAQEAAVEEHCSRNGLEIVDTIREQVSGRKDRMDRPGLSRAISILESGMASGLVVWDLDRLSRNLADAADMVRRYFGEGAPYELAAVNEKIDTRSPEGRMYLHMKLVFAEYEAAKIGERIRAVKEYLRSQGVYAGGGVPFGWRVSARNPGGHHELVLHPEEQALIRRAVELRELGMSLRGIAAQLHQEGATSRGQKALHPQQVSRMIAAAE